MARTAMEFRTRSRHAPNGELRIWLGRPTNRSERQELDVRRVVLRALARAGDWTTLSRLQDGNLTVEQVVTAFRRHGIEGYLSAIKSARSAPLIEERFYAYLETIANPGSRKSYRSAGRRVIEVLGASTPIDKVTAHDVNEMIQGFRGKYQPYYLSKLLIVGSGLYTWLMAWDKSESQKTGHARLLPENPFREAKPVATPTTRHRFLEPDEFQRIVKAAGPEMAAMYATALWGGLRPTELLRLRPEDIEIPTRIRIQPHPDGWGPKGWPKSTRGVRDIPIRKPELLRALKLHAKLYAGEDRFFVNPRSGAEWSYEAWRRQVRRDVLAAGLTFGSRDPRGITPHTFRHTIASWMTREDVQMKKIATFLGNTVVICERHYSHLLPGDLDDMVQRLRAKGVAK